MLVTNGCFGRRISDIIVPIDYYGPHGLIRVREIELERWLNGRKGKLEVRFDIWKQ